MAKKYAFDEKDYLVEVVEDKNGRNKGKDKTVQAD